MINNNKLINIKPLFYKKSKNSKCIKIQCNMKYYKNKLILSKNKSTQLTEYIFDKPHFTKLKDQVGNNGFLF